MTALPRLTAALKRHKRICTLGRLPRITGSAALLCALFLLPGQALAVNDDAVLRRMDAVLEENTRLRDDAWKARKHGRDAAKQAEEALSASDDRLERTRAEALAHVAGVTPAQVESLRKDGKSWGQAAGELGVHPGFLGVGKAPLYQSLPPKRKAAADDKVKKSGKKSAAKVQAKAADKGGAEKKAKVKKESKAAPKAKAKTVKKEKKSSSKS